MLFERCVVMFEYCDHSRVMFKPNHCSYPFLFFIRPFEKMGRIMGTRAAAEAASRAFVRSITFHCIIIKLCQNICWQNISAKFDNQPDPMKHFWVMVLELAKIDKINHVRSVTSICFNGSSSNFVTMFVGIISWPS